MNDPKKPALPSKGQFLVYPAEDGQTKIEVRLENETVWLTQQHMAELFQTSKQNVGQHLKNIFEEGELAEDSVVNNFFTTAADGNCQGILDSSNRGGRSVQRRVEFYNLDAIINDRNILTHAGKISHQMAKQLAESEYDIFNRQRVQQTDAAGGEVEKAIKQLPTPPKPKKKRGKK